MDWSKKNRPNCVHERGDILGALAGATFLQRRSAAGGRTRVCDRAGPSDLKTRARARICRSPLEKPSGVHRTQGCREARRDFQRRCRVRCNLALCLMCGAAASMAGWRRNLRVHRPRGRNMAGQGDLARRRHVPERSVFTYWVWGTRLRAGTRSRASLDGLDSGAAREARAE